MSSRDKPQLARIGVGFDGGPEALPPGSDADNPVAAPARK
jgi:hypothetical protein